MNEVQQGERAGKKYFVLRFTLADEQAPSTSPRAPLRWMMSSASSDLAVRARPVYLPATDRGYGSAGACQGRLDGVDLHANVSVAADNYDGLEQLARYALRPPIA
jgi:hypothetical protein